MHHFCCFLPPPCPAPILLNLLEIFHALMFENEVFHQVRKIVPLCKLYLQTFTLAFPLQCRSGQEVVYEHGRYPGSSWHCNSGPWFFFEEGEKDYLRLKEPSRILNRLLASIQRPDGQRLWSRVLEEIVGGFTLLMHVCFCFWPIHCSASQHS